MIDSPEFSNAATYNTKSGTLTTQPQLVSWQKGYKIKTLFALKHFIFQCATRALTSEEILDCASGSQGSEYLAEYGNITNDLMPELKSVPTVVFNDVSCHALLVRLCY